ncbi:hypothetical protein D9757_001058 [Collybiopsis confluens]|uniref:Uncharacterized protein n=1 Tax=Collybiopsis confluens TaxID=2823264 RepID=A0A8H5MGE1_9AGAR|nr:hypothetical protein D9757_001058 [Collybiopsis confluens]
MRDVVQMYVSYLTSIRLDVRGVTRIFLFTRRNTACAPSTPKFLDPGLKPKIPLPRRRTISLSHGQFFAPWQNELASTSSQTSFTPSFYNGTFHGTMLPHFLFTTKDRIVWEILRKLSTILCVLNPVAGNPGAGTAVPDYLLRMFPWLKLTLFVYPSLNFRMFNLDLDGHPSGQMVDSLGTSLAGSALTVKLNGTSIGLEAVNNESAGTGHYSMDGGATHVDGDGAAFVVNSPFSHLGSKAQTSSNSTNTQFPSATDTYGQGNPKHPPPSNNWEPYPDAYLRTEESMAPPTEGRLIYTDSKHVPLIDSSSSSSSSVGPIEGSHGHPAQVPPRRLSTLKLEQRLEVM